MTATPGIWTKIRALAFNAAFFFWSAMLVLYYTPSLFMPRRILIGGQRRWTNHVNALLRTIVGIRIEIRGRERLPAGPFIAAAKHQSAWDTLIWHTELDDPAIVLKKELLSIPVYGRMCRKSRMIAVDRAGGPSALKAMVADARAEIAASRPIVIFPQGTRTAPGAPVEAAPYQPGVAALYRALDVPVVPVALNSGLFWARRSFLKRPGTIVLEYREPIPPGLDRRSFMATLTDRIEGGTAQLEAEAQAAPAVTKAREETV